MVYGVATMKRTSTITVLVSIVLRIGRVSVSQVPKVPRTTGHVCIGIGVAVGNGSWFGFRLSHFRAAIASSRLRVRLQVRQVDSSCHAASAACRGWLASRPSIVPDACYLAYVRLRPYSRWITHFLAPNATNVLGSTNGERAPSVVTNVATDGRRRPACIGVTNIATTVTIDVPVTTIVTDTDVARLIGRRKNHRTSTTTWVLRLAFFYFASSPSPTHFLFYSLYTTYLLNVWRREPSKCFRQMRLSNAIFFCECVCVCNHDMNVSKSNVTITRVGIAYLPGGISTMFAKIDFLKWPKCLFNKKKLPIFVGR